MELVLASSLVAAALMATIQRPERSTETSIFRHRTTRQTISLEDLQLEYADLPCPWCNAATREDDRSCPSCGQRFG